MDGIVFGALESHDTEQPHRQHRRIATTAGRYSRDRFTIRGDLGQFGKVLVRQLNVFKKSSSSVAHFAWHADNRQHDSSDEHDYPQEDDVVVFSQNSADDLPGTKPEKCEYDHRRLGRKVRLRWPINFQSF
jgi:hypothetical protein